MLDMIKPARGCITLGDLKRCKMTPIFFDTFFNLEKYLEHEQRDPFATQRDLDEVSGGLYGRMVQELMVVFTFCRCPIGIVMPHKSMNCWWPKRAERRKGKCFRILTLSLYFPLLEIRTNMSRFVLLLVVLRC